jgi:hypothetical protein
MSDEGSAEQATADVAAGGGDLAQLVEEVHGSQVGWPQLGRGPEATGSERHGVGEQALDQVVGGVLEGGPVAVGKTAKAEPNPSGGFLDGQGQWFGGHIPRVPPTGLVNQTGRPAGGGISCSVVAALTDGSWRCGGVGQA